MRNQFFLQMLSVAFATTLLAGAAVAQTATTTATGGTAVQGANGGKAYAGPRVKAVKGPNGRTSVRTANGVVKSGPNGSYARGPQGAVAKDANGNVYTKPK